MTVETSTSRVQYATNGTTGPWSVPFYFLADADLRVVYADSTGAETELVLTTDYSVTGAADPSGGAVTTVISYGAGGTITVVRELEALQPTDYADTDAFPANVLERNLDRLTMLAQQQAEVSARSIVLPVSDESSVTIPSAAERASKLFAFDASGDLALVAPTSGDATDLALDLSSSSVAAKGSGQVGHGNGVPYTSGTVGYQLPWATFRGTGGDDTTAIQALLTAGYNVQLSGTSLVNNLTAGTAGQRLRAAGRARLIKNANGPLITFSADDQEADGIEFRGDASSPTYTGDNVVSTGNNFRLINCGSRWAYARAVKATGDAPLIEGCCDIYQTTDATGSGYDIEFGLSGTARLYGRVIGIRTTQATGGILFTDTGSFSVIGSQVGKITVASGTSPGGVNGGNFNGNRILGAVTVGISNACFSGNTISAVAVSFASGTSGHAFDESNVLASGATLTDDSNLSNVVDSRLVPFQTYTSTWTGSVSNPAIGNGTLTAYRSSVGKKTTVSIKMTAGSTTTFGSGDWYFSLPSIPSTSLNQAGSAIAFDSGTNFRIGAVQTLTDGTAKCFVTFDSDSGAASSARPMTWANGDTLNFSLTYWE